jgi:glycine cleavage system H protein
MSNIPGDLKYTADHEWVRMSGRRAHVGITDFAQEQLGDVVYVELPRAGATVTAGKAMGVVESVKAASDILSPLTGTVLEINPALTDRPELVNSDPYGDGWMIVVEPSTATTDDLLDAPAYEALVAG